MPGYSKNDIVLIRYPFSDLSGSKVRPAIIVSTPHPSQDLFIVPMTSRTAGLLAGEFILDYWEKAGLNVPTPIKRGLYTIHEKLVVKAVGRLVEGDARRVETSLRGWLGL